MKNISRKGPLDRRSLRSASTASKGEGGRISTSLIAVSPHLFSITETRNRMAHICLEDMFTEPITAKYGGTIVQIGLLGQRLYASCGVVRHTSRDECINSGA